MLYKAHIESILNIEIIIPDFIFKNDKNIIGYYADD
jgi:hypothetical protein